MRRHLIIIAVAATAGALLAGPATATAAPTPVGPASVSVPAGRSVLQVDPGNASRVVAPPTGLRPKTVASPPYGGEAMAGEQTPGSQNRIGCGNGFNARSNSGAQYMLTAGHCTRQTAGRWFYPWNSINIVGDFVAQTNYDSTGDRGAIHATRPLNRQVRSQCCIYTVTASGDPQRLENVCAPLAERRVTLCGFISFIDQHPTFLDGTDHGNMAILQANGSELAHCPIIGDSGSPVLAGTEGVGMVIATSHDEANCWVWLEQIGYTLSSYQLRIVY